MCKCLKGSVSCVLSVPYGAVLGIVLVSIGIGMTAHGLRMVSDVTSKYGGSFHSVVSILVATFSVVTALDVLVACVGFREFLRLNRFSCCRQCCEIGNGVVGWCSCLVSWVVYLSMQLCCWVSIGLSLALLLVCYALFLLGLAISSSCNGSESAVSDLIDMMNKKPINAGLDVNDDDIGQFCNDFNKVKDGSQSAFIGSLLIVVAQVRSFPHCVCSSLDILVVAAAAAVVVVVTCSRMIRIAFC